MNLPANGVGVFHQPIDADSLDSSGLLRGQALALIFDEASEALVAVAGMGGDYTAQTRNSWMVLEGHLTFEPGIAPGSAVTVTSRVVDCDAKRVHLYQEMSSASGAHLATQEQLLLHVSLVTRRSAPFEPQVAAAFSELQRAQSGLPVPTVIGRRVALDAAGTG